VAVVFPERLANALGLLLPQRRALELGQRFTLTDLPDDSLVGSAGGLGQVTGYVQVDGSGGPTGATGAA
jgi:hypothetical protein